MHLPVLGVTAELMAVDVDALGELQIPENIRQVGWYRQTAAPGERGVTMLAGHRDGANGTRGALYDLAALDVRDRLAVADRGRRFTYEVTAVEVFPGTGQLPARTVDPTGPSRLVLVSCGGQLRPGLDGALHWDSRVLVWADLLH